MKRILSVLGLTGALLVSACGGKGNVNREATVERDSTFTSVKHPEWSRNAVIYEVNLRQYTALSFNFDTVMLPLLIRWLHCDILKYLYLSIFE